jgi:hypothetical protein
MEIHEVVGYDTCTLCPNLVLKEVARHTGGICSECFAGGAGPDMRHIEVVGRGYKIRVPPRKTRRTTHARDVNHHAVEKAKGRALKRLKAIFPDLYDTLLAEERARAGLNPWPTYAAVRHSGDPDCSKTIEFAEVYHALDRGEPS